MKINLCILVALTSLLNVGIQAQDRKQKIRQAVLEEREITQKKETFKRLQELLSQSSPSRTDTEEALNILRRLKPRYFSLDHYDELLAMSSGLYKREITAEIDLAKEELPDSARRFIVSNWQWLALGTVIALVITVGSFGGGALAAATISSWASQLATLKLSLGTILTFSKGVSAVKFVGGLLSSLYAIGGIGEISSSALHFISNDFKSLGEETLEEAQKHIVCLEGVLTILEQQVKDLSTLSKG